MQHAPSAGDATVHHADLFGERNSKYRTLLESTAATIDTAPIVPNSPYYFFIRRDETHRSEYEAGWQVRDVIPVNSTGIVTARDGFVIDLDDAPIEERLRIFLDVKLTDAEVQERLGLSENYAWRVADARKQLGAVEGLERRFRDILYRPFDQRRIIYHKSVVWRTRHQVMRHMLAGDNLGLITVRQVAEGIFNHVFVTRSIVESRITLSNKGIGFVYPLYLYPVRSTLRGGDRREANLGEAFIAGLTEALDVTWAADGQGDLGPAGTVGPEDVLHYVYGQFHSAVYRDRYAEFLRMEFPRVFLTENLDLFRSLCQLGADLVALHLLEDDYEPASWDAGSGPLTRSITRLVGEGQPEVAKGYPGYEDGKVYINNACYFDGVPEEVWNFHIGGYQVCRKWLKDRGPRKGNPGRVLTDDDIAHYQKIVLALNETIRIMAETDKVIDAHGGWPEAFVTEKQ